MRGGRKGPVEEEEATIKFAYASVVVLKDIAVGEQFTLENIWVKRPGTGDYLAEDFDYILGKVAARPILSEIRLKDDFKKL